MRKMEGGLGIPVSGQLILSPSLGEQTPVICTRNAVCSGRPPVAPAFFPATVEAIFAEAWTTSMNIGRRSIFS